MKKIIICVLCLVMVIGCTGCAYTPHKFVNKWSNKPVEASTTATETEHVHNFIPVSTSMTCTQPLTTVYQCECGETKTEVSEIIGEHSYTTVTEVLDGCKKCRYSVCTVCGERDEDTYEEFVTHEFVTAIEVYDESSCITSTIYRCSECGEIVKETDKAQHAHTKYIHNTSANQYDFLQCTDCGKYVATYGHMIKTIISTPYGDTSITCKFVVLNDKYYLTIPYVYFKNLYNQQTAYKSFQNLTLDYIVFKSSSEWYSLNLENEAQWTNIHTIYGSDYRMYANLQYATTLVIKFDFAD